MIPDETPKRTDVVRGKRDDAPKVVETLKTETPKVVIEVQAPPTPVLSSRTKQELSRGSQVIADRGGQRRD